MTLGGRRRSECSFTRGKIQSKPQVFNYSVSGNSNIRFFVFVEFLVESFLFQSAFFISFIHPRFYYGARSIC